MAGSGAAPQPALERVPQCRRHAGSWWYLLLGELYGRDPNHSVPQLLGSEQGAVGQNGHFLLCAWETESRRWHVWTDRFGTVHAYLGSGGRCTALGTFSPAVAAVSSRCRLDWTGLMGFFGQGFFPDDRTHFEDVRHRAPRRRT